jgi:ribosome maturation protein SDO1
MVRVDDAAIIRLERGGARFEVLADPDAVLAIREGKKVQLNDALAVTEIFKDARAADKAGTADIKKVFGTETVEDAAMEIILKGEFHLTTEQKRKMAQRVRNQVVEMIARNSVDPRTKLPHTRERIEWALNEAGVKIDDRPVARQVDEIIKKIRPVLPISFGTAVLEVIVPSQYAPSLYGMLKGMGKLTKEQWLANGSLQVRLEVPSGTKVDIMDKLGDATKGEAIIKEV